MADRFHGNEQHMEYEKLLNRGTRGNDDNDDDDDQDVSSADNKHTQTGSMRQPDNRCEQPGTLRPSHHRI